MHRPVWDSSSLSISEVACCVHKRARQLSKYQREVLDKVRSLECGLDVFGNVWLFSVEMGEKNHKSDLYK